MLIPSQREMVFLQYKSFFLCIDPLVQLEFPEEKRKFKKRRGGGRWRERAAVEGEEKDETLECS